MGLRRSILLIINLLLNFVQNVRSIPKDGTVCVPEQINAHIALANIDEKQLELVQELIKNITDRQANGSTFSLSLVGKGYRHVGQFTIPVSPDTIRSMVTDIKNDAKKREVSVHALVQATLAAFPYNQYGTMAEILILSVGNTTVLPNKTETIDKKKTFLIGIGEPVKKNFSEMATREDHLFWLNTTRDLSDVSAAISAQICEDSKYPCDVDMYKPKTSAGDRARCRNCSELKSGTCNVCPYYPSKHCMKNNSEFKPAFKADTDKKLTIAVAVGIPVVVIAVGIGVFFCCIRKGKKQYLYSKLWLHRGSAYREPYVQSVRQTNDSHERSHTSTV